MSDMFGKSNRTFEVLFNCVTFNRIIFTQTNPNIFNAYVLISFFMEQSPS